MYVYSNHFYLNQDSIAAIATPIGSGGIGIIRISGSQACLIANKLFQKSSKNSELQSHLLYHGHICDPSNNQIVDEVLLTAMKAPRSYTREDVVEIQSHSGQIVLAKILDLVIANGARLAEPGEFTRRAFLNGRIDLSQAEAVADLINARSEKALSIASDHMSGRMKGTVKMLIEQITAQMAIMEAGIEFPEEIEEELDPVQVSKIIKHNIILEVEKLIQQYEDCHFVRDGVRLSIAGRPNVGKSSLLNCLIQKDKAIVTPIAGTTRDLIEDAFNICGIPVIISDTAGLRLTEDPIEKIGIKKTRDNIDISDLVLFVIDATERLTDEDRKELDKLREKNVLLVINKIDLVPEFRELDLPDRYKALEQYQISALTGENVEHLKKMIAQKYLNDMTFQPGHTIIPNLRQKKLLEGALTFLDQALQGLNSGMSFELVISDLEMALNSLKGITGENINNDILNEIFNQFCIGK